MARQWDQQEVPDSEHPCPACGSPWVVPWVFIQHGAEFGPGEGEWSVPQGGGRCSNPACPMTSEQVGAFQAERRAQGWDAARAR